jgi:acyl-coenzyme A thioesterase 13
VKSSLSRELNANSMHIAGDRKFYVLSFFPMTAKNKDSGSPSNLENYQHPDKFGDWLGYKVVHVDPKTHSAEVQLQIREDHLSPANRVHGGVVSSFFDFAFGVAVFSSLGPRDFCSTVELKVNYLRPIELGDLLVARTSMVHRGKRLCVLHGYAYRNEETQPVAMATATFNVVAHKA